MNKRPRKRLIGIDAARGLALIGLMAIHILPNYDEETGDPTLVWQLFSGDSAALFALLAGVGLALSSGGRTPHRGRQMTGGRVSLVVRAALIAVVALVIASLMPQNGEPPAYSILMYYAAFFLLAIPFLQLGPKALFIGAAVFGIVSPLLLQQLPPVLPDWASYNPTVEHILADPASVASQLLLTGTYPALPYMTYILAGLGLGRLDLRNTRVQAAIAGLGAALAILANTTSYVLLYAAGGYQALLDTGMTEDGLDEAIVYGPELVPDTSGWWLAIATPHANMPLAIAGSLGMALLAAGLFLLIANRAGRWLIPLAAMGAMTLTLYSVHLVALSFELHYYEPVLWFLAHLAAAVAFAWAWNHWIGQGPLEKIVSLAAKGTRRLVTGAPNSMKSPTSPHSGAPVRTSRGTIMYTDGEDHAGYTDQPANDPDTTTR
ncbi:heparan-alpha-glucosaminide N-acetyltransferase domain-containing protein [Citricoccus nitrophenolicus]